MLKKMCSERQNDWDKFGISFLFIYFFIIIIINPFFTGCLQIIPQESRGFSPFELLYNRTVRDPMMILKELRTKDMPDEVIRDTYHYMIDLRERLDETCQLAESNLKVAKVKQARFCNRKAPDRGRCRLGTRF